MNYNEYKELYNLVNEIVSFIDFIDKKERNIREIIRITRSKVITANDKRYDLSLHDGDIILCKKNVGKILNSNYGRGFKGKIKKELLTLFKFANSKEYYIGHDSQQTFSTLEDYLVSEEQYFQYTFLYDDTELCGRLFFSLLKKKINSLSIVIRLSDIMECL